MTDYDCFVCFAVSSCMMSLFMLITYKCLPICYESELLYKKIIRLKQELHQLKGNHPSTSLELDV
jgi:hypothetical protein